MGWAEVDGGGLREITKTTPWADKRVDVTSSLTEAFWTRKYPSECRSLGHFIGRETDRPGWVPSDVSNNA